MAVRKGLPLQHCVVSPDVSPHGFARLALISAKTQAHSFAALKMKPLGTRGLSEHYATLRPKPITCHWQDGGLLFVPSLPAQIGGMGLDCNFSDIYIT